MKNSEILFNQTIRSYSLILCICLFLTNWLCLGLITTFSNMIQSCSIQSYSLHVLIYFHLHLILYLHFYWYYYLTFKNSSEKLTYCQFNLILLFIFIYLCLLTLPSLSNQWGSIIYDKILQICIVNYKFNYSYTFFLLTFTCLIPFIFLILFHQQQRNEQFQYSSFLIILWTFLNILLLICLHIPIKHIQIRIFIYYTQISLFLIEPIFYIFIFRSLTRISLLKSSNQIYFI